MTTTQTGTYITRLAGARKTNQAARKALDTARQHVTPPTPDMHNLFLTMPENYAKALRQMAEILETLPALTAAADTAAATLAPLEAQACWKCDGTGQYTAPTRATRHGIPYCFTCDGQGHQ